jgi:hypothetical protein
MFSWLFGPLFTLPALSAYPTSPRVSHHPNIEAGFVGQVGATGVLTRLGSCRTAKFGTRIEIRKIFSQF